MSLPPSTANWHWKNKNCTRWGTEWLKRELTTLTVTSDKPEETASIKSVSEVDGDIELGQRKSKLITIFDVKIELQWEGKTTDGKDVKGKLTIPEVSHEIVCDQSSDYTFDWSLSTSSSPEVNSVYQLARSRLPELLKAKLAEFPVALIDTHGRDITVSADPSRTGTPTPATTAAAPAPATSASTPAQKPKAPAKAFNTSKVEVNATFQASAADLFGLLTDEKRIPQWTRAPAVSKAEPGSEYSLFGGGVKGKYVSLTPEKEIVQSWALSSPSWPSGHEATLTTTLDQSTDSTKVTFTLTAVPLGMEEEIKGNIQRYYIHGFNSIGYVSLVRATPVYSSSYVETKAKAKQAEAPPTSYSYSSPPLAFLIMAGLMLIAALAVPYLSLSNPPNLASRA